MLCLSSSYFLCKRQSKEKKVRYTDPTTCLEAHFSRMSVRDQTHPITSALSRKQFSNAV
jgi:hypothetical protein